MTVSDPTDHLMCMGLSQLSLYGGKDRSGMFDLKGEGIEVSLWGSHAHSAELSMHVYWGVVVRNS